MIASGEALTELEMFTEDLKRRAIP